MKILSIETSCDETAVSVVQAKGGLKKPDFSVLGQELNSQIDVHKKYGGVFPSLAKREHTKNLVPVTQSALSKAGLLNKERIGKIEPERLKKIKKILDKNSAMFEPIAGFLEMFSKPEIDLIAVTYGPGLEPALWTGINHARALSFFWNTPIIPVNHMEGHIFTPLLDKNKRLKFPALALLISGGHTELVLIKDWANYKIIGQTKDDAVGEAYDKVARMMNLPYPGGPEISKLAEEEEEKKEERRNYSLPRPMINSSNFDFSFSGLKTAVLYTLKQIENPDVDAKRQIAKEFESAVKDVLIAKTRKALYKYEPETLILGGGVTANKTIRKAFEGLINEFTMLNILLPETKYSTDNAVMIAVAGYFKFLTSPRSVLKPGERDFNSLRAEGCATL